MPASSECHHNSSLPCRDGVFPLPGHSFFRDSRRGRIALAPTRVYFILNSPARWQAGCCSLAGHASMPPLGLIAADAGTELRHTTGLAD